MTGLALLIKYVHITTVYSLFSNLLSRRQQKAFFSKLFCSLLFEGTFTSFFKDKIRNNGCKPLSIPAAGLKDMKPSDHTHLELCMAYRVSILRYPCTLWYALHHVYTVNSQYKQYQREQAGSTELF